MLHGFFDLCESTLLQLAPSIRFGARDIFIYSLRLICVPHSMGPYSVSCTVFSRPVLEKSSGAGVPLFPQLPPASS